MRPRGVSTITIILCVLTLGDFLLLPTSSMLSFVSVVAEVALSYLLFWYFWSGRNWARILMLFVSLGSIIVLGSVSFPLGSAAIYNSVLAAWAVVGLFQIYYLHKSGVRSWFKHFPEVRRTSRFRIMVVVVLTVIVSIYGLEAMHVKYLRSKVAPANPPKLMLPA